MRLLTPLFDWDYLVISDKTSSDGIGSMSRRLIFCHGYIAVKHFMPGDYVAMKTFRQPCPIKEFYYNGYRTLLYSIFQQQEHINGYFSQVWCPDDQIQITPFVGIAVYTAAIRPYLECCINPGENSYQFFSVFISKQHGSVDLWLRQTGGHRK